MTSKVDFTSFEKISYYISKNQAKLKNVLRTNPEIRFINICYKFYLSKLCETLYNRIFITCVKIMKEPW